MNFECHFLRNYARVWKNIFRIVPPSGGPDKTYCFNLEQHRSGRRAAIAQSRARMNIASKIRRAAFFKGSKFLLTRLSIINSAARSAVMRGFVFSRDLIAAEFQFEE